MNTLSGYEPGATGREKSRSAFAASIIAVSCNKSTAAEPHKNFSCLKKELFIFAKC